MDLSFAGAAAALLLLGGAACGRRTETGGPPIAGDPAASSSMAPIAVRVIQPRGSPRAAFDLRLQAVPAGGDDWSLLLHLGHPRGGSGSVEFSLPDGFEVIEGEIRREFTLQPGEDRLDRIVIRVPRTGYRTIAASAVIEGRREEAYAVFGERPTAEERGLRIRVTGSGERVLRSGPEDAGR
jgi:hypothetical protein